MDIGVAAVMAAGFAAVIGGLVCMFRNKSTPAGDPLITINLPVLGTIRIYNDCLAYVVVGILAVMFGANLSQGPDDVRPSADTSSRLAAISVVFAQESLDWDQGWVYLGEEDDPAEWVLYHVDDTAQGVPFLIGDIARATGHAYIRSSVPSRLSGTVLRLFTRTPEAIGTIEVFDCVEVLNSEIISGSMWLEVVPAACPD